MDKVRYMISDAANIVDVETHVLRYWEEELELDIPRNEMGHRYYTRENINQFQKIKELKALGYQLRTIKSIIHEGQNYDANINEASGNGVKMRGTNCYGVSGRGVDANGVSSHGVDIHEEDYEESTALCADRAGEVHIDKLTSEDRMNQFRELMSDIVGQAIALNNEELSLTIGNEVGERVLKEMNYLMREQDNIQEERYKMLDAAIRGNVRKKTAIFGKKKRTGKAGMKKPAHA